ncbi:hypothetical protein AB1Y20_020658 [Prymnesium parvum]|uniref:Bestrophin homolog n=1 Tax=Prymnesium parvum TaxID=97485 RepID=A0AB34JYR4_PRYPA
MIPYLRTKWYGLRYLLQWKGTLFVRCIGPVTVAMAISGVTSSGLLNRLGGGQDYEDWFGHPMSIQLVGLVFGYFSVSRLQICYQRYWEGVTHIQVMLSKWSDAAAQIIAFDRIPDLSPDLSHEPFCRHVVHLFSTMSALAMLELHFDSMMKSRRPADEKRTNSFFYLQTATEKGLPCIEGLDPDEVIFYTAQADPVLAASQRISRTILTRYDAGGLQTPTPIVSRIFQEVSNGLLSYNNATKLKEIPVPFAYVQAQAFMIWCFTLLAPFAIASFTKTVTMSVLCSAIIVGSFTLMWLVANEMEDPYGGEECDLPMLEYHEAFNHSMQTLLAHPWMPSDTWLVADGAWQPPRRPPPAADSQQSSFLKKRTERERGVIRIIPSLARRAAPPPPAVRAAARLPPLADCRRHSSDSAACVEARVVSPPPPQEEAEEAEGEREERAVVVEVEEGGGEKFAAIEYSPVLQMWVQREGARRGGEAAAARRHSAAGAEESSAAPQKDHWAQGGGLLACRGTVSRMSLAGLPIPDSPDRPPPALAAACERKPSLSSSAESSIPSLYGQQSFEARTASPASYSSPQTPGKSVSQRSPPPLDEGGHRLWGALGQLAAEQAESGRVTPEQKARAAAAAAEQAERAAKLRRDAVEAEARAMAAREDAKRLQSLVEQAQQQLSKRTMSSKAGRVSVRRAPSSPRNSCKVVILDP